jgi:hypothetical protein
VTDLAATESVAQPTMTTLVVRLERDGLVERGSDAADGRAVLVSITDEGLATLRRFSAARAEVLGARLETLSAVAFACVVAFMGIGLVDPILPAIASQLHASPSQVELLFTSYFAVTGAAMPPRCR